MNIQSQRETINKALAQNKPMLALMSARTLLNHSTEIGDILLYVDCVYKISKANFFQEALTLLVERIERTKNNPHITLLYHAAKLAYLHSRKVLPLGKTLKIWKKRRSQAEQYIDQALAINDVEWRTRVLELGVTIKRHLNKNEIAADLEAELATASQNARIYYDKALRYYKQGNDTVALKNLTAAISLNKKDTNFYILRVLLYLRNNEPELAERAIDLALHYGLNADEWNFQMYRIRETQERYLDAAEHLESIDSKKPRYLLAKAYFYMHIGQRDLVSHMKFRGTVDRYEAVKAIYSKSMQYFIEAGRYLPNPERKITTDTIRYWQGMFYLHRTISESLDIATKSVALQTLVFGKTEWGYFHGLARKAVRQMQDAYNKRLISSHYAENVRKVLNQIAQYRKLK